MSAFLSPNFVPFPRLRLPSPFCPPPLSALFNLSRSRSARSRAEYRCVVCMCARIRIHERVFLPFPTSSRKRPCAKYLYRHRARDPRGWSRDWIFMSSVARNFGARRRRWIVTTASFIPRMYSRKIRLRINIYSNPPIFTAIHSRFSAAPRIPPVRLLIPEGDSRGYRV